MVSEQAFHARLAVKNCSTGYQKIERAAKAVDVRLFICIASVRGLFWRHGIKFTHSNAALRQIGLST